MYKAKWLVVHNGKSYKPGDEFEDKPTKELLDTGAVYKVEAKSKAKDKNETKGGGE